MRAMAKLRPHVDAFFDKVTVNVEDKTLRENRLKLLNEIRAATRAVADFSQDRRITFSSPAHRASGGREFAGLRVSRERRCARAGIRRPCRLEPDGGLCVMRRLCSRACCPFRAISSKPQENPMLITATDLSPARRPRRRHPDPDHAPAAELHRRHLSHFHRPRRPQQRSSLGQFTLIDAAAALHRMAAVG